MPYGLMFKFGPYVMIALLLGLYLDKRDDLVQAIESCNTDKIRIKAESEESVRKTLSEAHDRELSERDRLQKEAEKALQRASLAAEQAEIGLSEKQQRITQLELEASIDEIPDSAECMLVYVPSGVLLERNCDSAGGGGSGEGGACRNTGDIDQNDPAFSRVTFGDLAELSNHNISTIDKLNGQLRSIEVLNDGPEE